MTDSTPGATPEATPEALFRRYREDGDARSLAALFDRTAPEIYRVACYLSGDPSEAEDLLQATYLVAIERAASFRASARVVPWLLGILANKARRLREQQLREPRRRQEPPDRVAAPAGEEPAAAAQGQELRACLEQELSRLTSSLRPVLVLHLQHGLGAAEIARILDRPAGTVRSQICRGMEFLRQSLPPGLAGLGAVALTPAAIPAAALAQVRKTVLARAAQAVSDTTATTATTASVAAILAVITNTKVVLSCLTATLMGVALLLWGPWQVGADDVPGLSGVPAGTPSGDTGSETEAAPARTGTPDRDVVSPELPAGEGVLVKIVAEDTGEPLAGAEILQAPVGFSWPAANQLILQGRDHDYELELRRSGEIVITDVRGLARLLYHVQYHTCWVRKGELYGWFDVARPEGEDIPQVVAVGRDRWVDVRVVDAASQPLPGVPVGVGRDRNPGWLSYAGISKADGILRVKHLQNYRAERDAEGRRMLWVAPYRLCDAVEGVGVDLDVLPSQPVTLRYPPTGRLVVQLRDSRGRPWKRGLSSSGHPAPGSCLEVSVSALGPRNMTVTALADDEGRCLVPFVGLGERFHVRFLTDHHPFSLSRDVDGPKQAGQTVHVDLRAPHPLAILAGRLLYPSREPAANRTFRVGCRGSLRQVFQTDAHGGFRVGLHTSPRDDPAQGHVTRYFMEEGAGDPHFARVTVPRPDAPTEGRDVQLGTVVVQPVPVLVAGRVTGQRAWDRPRVSVWLNRDAMFQWLPRPVTLLQEDGRYEVRGFGGHAEHVLHVNCEGYIRQKIPFVAGTRDVAVRLLPAAEIQVEVRHSREAASGSFAVQLVPDDRTQARIDEVGAIHWSTPKTLHSKEAGVGFSWWSHVVPGTYRLDCLCVGFSRPALQIEGIEVRGGGRCEDPRLEAIDLTGSARPVTLTVLDAEGQPVSSGRAHVWDGSASAPGSPLWFRSGRLRLAMPVASVDLLVHAVGCRSQVVRQVAGDRTARLRKGIPVTFRLRGMPDLAPGVRFALRAEVDPGTTPFAERGGSWGVNGIFSPRSVERQVSGDFVFAMETPGVYALSLTLRQDRGAGVKLPVEPSSVRITDRDGQVFELCLAE